MPGCMYLLGLMKRSGQQSRCGTQHKSFKAYGGVYASRTGACEQATRMMRLVRCLSHGGLISKFVQFAVHLKSSEIVFYLHDVLYVFQPWIALPRGSSTNLSQLTTLRYHCINWTSAVFISSQLDSDRCQRIDCLQLLGGTLHAAWPFLHASPQQCTLQHSS